jgi:ketosteroid isomerase-like protein
MSHPNIALVQSLYAAFGRGDIATIVEAVAPDVHWECTGRRSDYPTLGAWQGRAQVGEFFSTVASSGDFHEFSPKEFHAAGDTVFCLGHYTFTVKKTGRRVDSDWIHVFTVKDGKVAQFREFLDTARAAEAWKS